MAEAVSGSALRAALKLEDALAWAVDLARNPTHISARDMTDAAQDAQTMAMNRNLVAGRKAGSALQDRASLQARRRLLRTCLFAPLVFSMVAIAGCANRKDLPPERRTRGRFGQGRP